MAPGHPRDRQDPRPQGARPGAEEPRRHQRPVDPEPADPGQRVGEHHGRPDHTLRQRPVRHRRRRYQQQPVPDHPARGRRPEAEHPSADLRGRHGQARRLPRGQQRRRARQHRRRGGHQQARDRYQHPPRRRPDHGPRRPVAGQRAGQHRRRSWTLQPPRRRLAVPLPEALADQDQPDGLLRPYIVRDAAAGRSITLNRYDFIRRAQQRVQPRHDWSVGDMQAPVLPPAQQGIPQAAYDLRPSPRPRAVPLGEAAPL